MFTTEENRMLVTLPNEFCVQGYAVKKEGDTWIISIERSGHHVCTTEDTRAFFEYTGSWITAEARERIYRALDAGEPPPFTVRDDGDFVGGEIQAATEYVTRYPDRYILVDDGQWWWVYPRVTMSEADSEAALSAMDGDQYRAWCDDHPWPKAWPNGAMLEIGLRLAEDFDAECWTIGRAGQE